MSVSSMKHVTPQVGQRYLSATQRALASSIGKLSPLQRQHAEARSNITEKMLQENSPSNLLRSASDAVSFTQVADDGLGAMQRLISQLYQRIQSGEVAGAGVNDALQKLRSGIDEIVQSTEYAGRRIFDGSAAENNTSVVKLLNPDGAVENLRLEVATTTSATLGLERTSSAPTQEKSLVMRQLSQAIDTVMQRRSTLEQAQLRLQTAISQGTDGIESTDLIRDGGSAEETLALVRKQILSQAGASMMSQASQLPQVALSLIGG